MAGKVVYQEPTDFIPEDIRKELKLGEYNDELNDEETQNERDNTELRRIFKGK